MSKLHEKPTYPITLPPNPLLLWTPLIPVNPPSPFLFSQEEVTDKTKKLTKLMVKYKTVTNDHKDLQAEWEEEKEGCLGLCRGSRGSTSSGGSKGTKLSPTTRRILRSRGISEGWYGG